MAFMASCCVALVFSGSASAAMEFKYGPARYELTAQYCVLGTTETMVGGYTGAQQNIRRRLPKVGQVFYVRLVANNPGLKCGGEWTYADISLPRGIKPAISRKHPIRCWFKGSGKWVRIKLPDAAKGSCKRRLGPSQTTHPLLRNWLGMNLVNGDVWPIPQGSTYRFDLPVKSSRVFVPRNSCSCVVGGFVTSSGSSRPENSWSYRSKTAPSRGPYGPMVVFPR
jgi:hypothetical protein